jgi:hypothetical protein
MKLRVPVYLVLLLLPWSLCAQNRDRGETPGRGDLLPSGDQILARHAEALGGEAAAAKITTRVMKGTLLVNNVGASGRYEIMAKAPNQFRSLATIENFGQTGEGFDGKTAWLVSPLAGRLELAGEEKGVLRRQADLMRPYRLNSHYAAVNARGKEILEGKPVYVLEAVPHDGTPEVFYFEVASGLLVRQDVQQPANEGKVTMETYFEDYREVDGIRVPFRWRQFTPVYNMTIQFQQVQQNVSVDENLFRRP